MAFEISKSWCQRSLSWIKTGEKKHTHRTWQVKKTKRAERGLKSCECWLESQGPSNWPTLFWCRFPVCSWVNCSCEDFELKPHADQWTVSVWIQWEELDSLVFYTRARSLLLKQLEKCVFNNTSIKSAITFSPRWYIFIQPFALQEAEYNQSILCDTRAF